MKQLILFLMIVLMPVIGAAQDGLPYDTNVWPDIREYMLRESKLESENAMSIIDTLDVPKPWKNFNRAMVILAKNGSILDNPVAADYLKDAIEEYGHPVFLYWYMIADFRKSTYKQYIGQLWENAPELAMDIEEIWEYGLTK